MKKLIVIILVLIGFAAYAQPSNSSQYLNQTAKWKFVKPQWLDSGMYLKNIVKLSNQNRVLCVDSVTGKVAYKYISSATTIDTTSLSNRINLKLNISDTAGMLSPYALTSEVPTYLAGNGIIKGGVTFYRDSLKSTGQYGNSWQNGMSLGSTNNRSMVYRTNGVQAMTLDSNQRLGLGIRTPSYKLDVLSTSNYAARIKGNAGGGFILGSLDANWGGFWSSGLTPTINNYSMLVHPTTGVAFNAPATTGNIQFNIDDVTKLRIFPTGNVSVGNTTSISQLSVSVAPTATGLYGLFSLSNTTTAFNGSTTGFYNGAVKGTFISVNQVGSVAYNFLDFQKNGVSKFQVDSLGKATATMFSGGIDTTKYTSQYGNSWQNGMYLGSSNNRSIWFRTNGVTRMKGDSIGRFIIGGDCKSTSTTNYGLEIKDYADGIFLNNTLGTRQTLKLHGAYTQILGDGSEFNFGTIGSVPISFMTNSTQRGYITTSGDWNIGNSSNFTTYGKLSVTAAPVATAGYASFSMGNTITAFNSSTTGKAVLAATGTYFAVNSVGSVAYNYLDFQKNGLTRFQVDSTGKNTFASTITTGGTTGNQTINKPSGTVNIAAAGTNVTVTNSLVSTSSIVVAVVRTNDTTAYIKNVVPSAGSFIITLGAAATSEVSIGFIVYN